MCPSLDIYLIIPVFQAAGIRVAVVVQSLTGVVAGVVIAFVFGWKLALVVLGTMPLMGIACEYKE